MRSTTPFPIRPALSAKALVASAAALAFALTALALAAPSARAVAPPRFVGIQAWDDPTGTQLDRLRAAKVNEFRAVLSWRSVEPNKPRCVGTYGYRNGVKCHDYRWKRYDRMFGMAARRGIRILPYLLSAPTWANSQDVRWQPTTPFARRAFGDFTAAVVKRYGPHGTFWKGRTIHPYATAAVRAGFIQIWNEPNLKNYWSNAPNPGQYASMLTAAATRAKAVDPYVKIVAAGLPWGMGISPEDFLRGMYKWNNGAVASKVDVIAIHIYKQYPFQVPPAVASVRSTLQGISRSAGLRPIWITEMGWATGNYDGLYVVSPSRQASNLTDEYNRLIAVKDDPRYNIDRAYWFNLEDDHQGRSNWWFHTGLFDRYDHPKPSWCAYKQITGAPC